MTAMLFGLGIHTVIITTQKPHFNVNTTSIQAEVIDFWDSPNSN